MTDADEASTLTRMPSLVGPGDQRRRRARQGIGDERVQRHVQRREAVEPCPLRAIERRRRPAVGQHRPLALVVEQHDDRPRPAADPAGDIDTLAAEHGAQRVAGWIVAGLPDEPRRMSGVGDRHGDVGSAAAAAADDRRRRVRRFVDRPPEADDDVFDDIADRANHPLDRSCARVGTWTSRPGSEPTTRA